MIEVRYGYVIFLVAIFVIMLGCGECSEVWGEISG